MLVQAFRRPLGRRLAMVVAILIVASVDGWLLAQPATHGAVKGTEVGPTAILLKKTATSLTVSPQLALGISPSRTSAIPGDPVRYAVTATNTGATLTVMGDITAQNTSL